MKPARTRPELLEFGANWVASVPSWVVEIGQNFVKVVQPWPNSTQIRPVPARSLRYRMGRQGRSRGDRQDGAVTTLLTTHPS